MIAKNQMRFWLPCSSFTIVVDLCSPCFVMRMHFLIFSFLFACLWYRSRSYAMRDAVDELTIAPYRSVESKSGNGIMAWSHYCALCNLQYINRAQLFIYYVAGCLAMAFWCVSCEYGDDQVVVHQLYDWWFEMRWKRNSIAESKMRKFLIEVSINHQQQSGKYTRA